MANPTIGSASTAAGFWTFGGSTARMRIFAGEDFWSLDGVYVPGGLVVDKTTCCVTLDLVVNADLSLSVPSTNKLPFTPAGSGVTYTAVLYDANDVERNHYLDDFTLPEMLGSSFTWYGVEIYNAQQILNPVLYPVTSYPTSALMYQAIADAIGTLNNASASIKGRTLLDVDPAVSALPTAVGINSPTLPTAGQRQALAGTSGTPSSTNLYVTDADPRLARDVKSYGAKGDVVDNAVGVGGTASCTNGSFVINDSALSLTSADVGKVFVLQGGGASGAQVWGPIGYGVSSGVVPNPVNSSHYPLVGTILQILSPTSFRSSVAASATASSEQMYYGTDDTVAFVNAIAATPAGGILDVPEGQYIANLTITKPMFLRGLGPKGSMTISIGSTLETFSVDNIKGVVIRTAGSSDVLTVQNTSGVRVEGLNFDGARISPYALKLDRVRESHFRDLAATRGATAGMIVGNSVFAGGTYGVDDGSFRNNFENIFAYGPSGIVLSKFGTATKGFANLSEWRNLHIEYYGQNAGDCGLGLINTGEVWFYNVYSFDHFNTPDNPWTPAGPPTPKPGIYIDGPYVDGYSSWNNYLVGVSATSAVVAAGNPFAGSILNLSLSQGGVHSPTIGAGSGLTWTSDGTDGSGSANLPGWHIYSPRQFFSLYSADDVKYTAFTLGRASENEAVFGIVGQAGNYFIGTAPGEAVVRVVDGTKRLNLGVGAGTAQIRILPTSVVFSDGANNFLGLNSFGGHAISTLTSANTDLAGQLTLNGSGVATYTFQGAYTSAPVCVVSDTAAPTLTPWCTTTTTTLTVHGDAGHVINYICIARN